MENIDYKSRADDMAQYIEEMHRMMNKASRRIAFMIEKEYPRDGQIDCLKCCIGLLQGESYEKYKERLERLSKLISKENQS